jgi:uncharacterized protein YndB with AHSA1/START domain
MGGVGAVRLAGLLALAAVAAPATAAVVEAVPTGFVSRNEALLAKPPAQVWAALLAWGAWWDPAHSYSGKPGQITLDPFAGGALEEKWPGGSVLHASVINVLPEKLLRMNGGFGPLQALPVNAVLDISLKPEGAGTRLSLTYRVGGPPQTKLPELAAPVDAVMTAGFQRLVRWAETGSPEETR